MERVAQFEEVSRQQFYSDMSDNFGIADVESENVYKNVRMPKRATSGSAGYDFYIPFNLELSSGKSVRIPTGVRCRMNPGWVLQIYPRSSLGFKYRVSLDNTVGIIDSDYYDAVNEGHIIIKITNHSDKMLSLKAGDRFAQGIFVQYGITFDDETTDVRKGGFGSTDRQEIFVEKRDMPGDDFIWDYSNSNPEVVSVELVSEGKDRKNENIFRFRFAGVSRGESEVRLLHKKKDEELVDSEQIFRVIVNENREVTLM
ncbi:MAG: hypothetical protein IIZ74_09605 [Erysipelotrichaceae bacterium]|nr:hypothetical protein [Erysipelotrichaceae bacterium]